MNPTISFSCKLLLPVSNLMQAIKNYQEFKSQDTSAENWGTIFLMILYQEKVYIHKPQQPSEISFCRIFLTPG